MSIPGQPLRGLVGQSMSGQRPALTPYVRVFPAGTTVFTVTTPGWYRIIVWGSGGRGLGGAAGSGGGLYVAERYLAYGQTVTFVVGHCGALGQDTTVTLPSGEVITAGAGGSDGSTTPGAGSSTLPAPGDISATGAARVGAAGGAAASSGTYVGGAGGPTNIDTGFAPGGGGGGGGANPITGGDGVGFLVQIRLGR